uniref:Uncharacterized protein n=1 Tax=Knipowitschia caucasica TaxID=637954 RepID=A0AAV2KHF4_KNICA
MDTIHRPRSLQQEEGITGVPASVRRPTVKLESWPQLKNDTSREASSWRPGATTAELSQLDGSSPLRQGRAEHQCSLSQSDQERFHLELRALSTLVGCGVIVRQARARKELKR